MSAALLEIVVLVLRIGAIALLVYGAFLAVGPALRITRPKFAKLLGRKPQPSRGAHEPAGRTVRP